MTTAAPPEAPRTVRVRWPGGNATDEAYGAKMQARLFGYVLHHNQLGLTEFVRAKRDQNTNRLKMLSRGNKGENKGDLWFPADDQELIAGAVAEYRDEYELFLTPACYNEPRSGNDSVSHSAVVWIDQDDPDKLHLLNEFDRPPHMVVSTGGSGGVHAYWRLSVPASRDEIVVLNRKLVGRLQADRQSVNAGRFLRVPGSLNMKGDDKIAEGADGCCRILWADLMRPPYDADELVDGLTDYKEPGVPVEQRRTRPRPGANAPGWIDRVIDEASGTPPPEYYFRITGIAVQQNGGLVSCPHPSHEDRNPSCHVFGEPGKGFYCFSCGATGNAFELAAYLSGWQGGSLRGPDFVEAARTVADALGVEIEKETSK